MARKKTKVTDSEAYDNLFVPLYAPKEKRKIILSTLKDSLILQQEYEQILELRGKKAAVLKEIKSMMNSLNKDFQELKKLFPNVKNVLSYTEKELEFLDLQLEQLKHAKKEDEEKIKEIESLEKSIIKGNLVKEVKTSKEKKVVSKSKKKIEKKEKEKPITKVDRIKNNLKLIEQKLASL
jgi:predicted site-specific integrase-resolvase